jgi:hypothetical protein
MQGRERDTRQGGRIVLLASILKFSEKSTHRVDPIIAQLLRQLDQRSRKRIVLAL